MVLCSRPSSALCTPAGTGGLLQPAPAGHAVVARGPDLKQPMLWPQSQCDRAQSVTVCPYLDALATLAAESAAAPPLTSAGNQTTVRGTLTSGNAMLRQGSCTHLGDCSSALQQHCPCALQSCPVQERHMPLSTLTPCSRQGNQAVCPVTKAATAREHKATWLAASKFQVSGSFVCRAAAAGAR